MTDSRIIKLVFFQTSSLSFSLSLLRGERPLEIKSYPFEETFAKPFMKATLPRE